MEIRDVVEKLIGPIKPVGDSNVDAKRLENLKEMTELVDYLMFQISELRCNSSRPEASMRTIGIHAENFLTDIHDSYETD